MNIYGAEILNKTPLMNPCIAFLIAVLITVVICLPVIFVLCIINDKFNFKSKAIQFTVNCIAYFICVIMMSFCIDNVCDYTNMYNYQVKINDNISLEGFINNNSDNFEMKLIDNEQNIWELKDK